MSYKVKVLIGAQNKEREIAKVLKENSKNDVESIEKIDNDTLEITFSDKPSCKLRRRIVQFSKKKYSSEAEIKKILEETVDTKCVLPWHLWKSVQIIEFPKVWIAFCKR